MDPFHSKALDFIRLHRLITPQDHIIAAVSGGPDSVALLHTLHFLREALDWKQITVAHFDHRLRGPASEEDMEFVRALAGRLGHPFVAGSADVRAHRESSGVSLEMAARFCRHGFFKQALEEAGARKLALGHNGDDQAEEVLLRLFRGTGPAGLAGMRPLAPGGIVRPLLFASRKEILEYLERRRLSFRVDASNLEPFCQRNALRLEILPLLEKHFHSRAVDTIGRYAELARDEESFWESHIGSLWPTVCVEEGRSRIVLDMSALQSGGAALERRIIRFAVEKLRGHLLGFYSVHVELLRTWSAKSGPGKALDLPGGLRALREGERHLVLTTDSPRPPEPFSWTFPGPGSYDLPLLELHIEILDADVADASTADASTMDASTVATKGTFKARMDADKVQWPLTVRSWQPGDRFRPLGLGGGKKLQDFFTDEKIPRTQRTCVPLLCDGEKICWVMGYRLDERVKVTSETRRILVVEGRFHTVHYERIRCNPGLD